MAENVPPLNSRTISLCYATKLSDQTVYILYYIYISTVTAGVVPVRACVPHGVHTSISFFISRQYNYN